MIIKYFAGRVYKPLLVKYLSHPKIVRFRGIRLVVAPGVFHPGFFFSTRLLLKFIEKQPLQNKSFLELGAGSGLISFYAARQGANVVSTDINPVAIRELNNNSVSNNISIEVVHSDMFALLSPKSFDIIAINPPYYKKDPSTDAEHAWYCGENGDYFIKLFSGLDRFTHAQTAIWMILCDGCDITMIRAIARKYDWEMQCVFEKKNLVESNFIFRIEKCDP